MLADETEGVDSGRDIRISPRLATEGVADKSVRVPWRPPGVIEAGAGAQTHPESS